MRKEQRWHDGQHFVIVNTETGEWVQQSYISRPKDLDNLNQHEVRCGRSPIYQEFQFTTEQIQQRNSLRK